MMKPYSRQNIDFLMQVFELNQLSEFAYFKDHDPQSHKMVLDMAEDLGLNYLWPALADSDRHPAEIIDGKVHVHKALPAFVKAYAEAGFISSTFSNDHDGAQLPKLLHAAVDYICMSCHNSFVMFTDLASGCAGLIDSFGNQWQKDTFLKPLLTGKWLGTMCLTEPQAGSSLSEITTKAMPNADGTYQITGQKIFISAGDHNLTENIVHLVLARIEGAPSGTKGISLFIVPKFRLDGTFNEVESIGLVHKMGQKATPAMHLGFNEGCEGYLLGTQNQGLVQMFQMMNGARLGVGLTGIACASAAYQLSLQYAHERIQGRSKNGLAKIIEHADVRRMLLHQKAMGEGGLALMFQCYQYLDYQKVSPKTKYSDLLELLTPVAKTFGAEKGTESVNLGLQILGGYGYTEDFLLEQLARDVRICSIYEGTTGIQSLALLGRQIPLQSGYQIWKEEVYQTIEKAENLLALSTHLKYAIEKLDDVTEYLLTINEKKGIEVFLADATLYMEAFSLVAVAWQWLKMADRAQNSEPSDFYLSKIHTAEFYFLYILPKIDSLIFSMKNSGAMTIKHSDKELII